VFGSVLSNCGNCFHAFCTLATLFYDELPPRCPTIFQSTHNKGDMEDTMGAHLLPNDWFWQPDCDA
jgi:hypothetical protein